MYLGLGVTGLLQQIKSKKAVEQTSWIAIITTCCTDSSIDIMTWMYSEYKKITFKENMQV